MPELHFNYPGEVAGYKSEKAGRIFYAGVAVAVFTHEAFFRRDGGVASKAIDRLVTQYNLRFGVQQPGVGNNNYLKGHEFTPSTTEAAFRLVFPFVPEGEVIKDVAIELLGIVWGKDPVAWVPPPPPPLHLHLLLLRSSQKRPSFRQHRLLSRGS